MYDRAKCMTGQNTIETLQCTLELSGKFFEVCFYAARQVSNGG